MTRQLTFDLPMRAALERADFFVSPANADALAMVDVPALWPQGKLLLCGPEGSGKSHLAEVFAHDSGAMILEGRDLFDPDILPDVMVIEDANLVATRQEETLFHLHNRMLAKGGLLLLTARQTPGHWGLRLPDLLSRMEGTAIARIQGPDDAVLAAVLVKLFADRQLQVAPSLITYLISRIDRSFAAAHALVGALDARALAQGRAVTRALAGELLDSWRQDSH